MAQRTREEEKMKSTDEVVIVSKRRKWFYPCLFIFVWLVGLLTGMAVVELITAYRVMYEINIKY